MEDTDEMSTTDFKDMKSFFVSLVSRMIIGDTAIRIGVVTYADGATTVFPLNQYSTGGGIISGITSINQGSNAYNRSSRYVDKALDHIQLNFFTTANGDRSNAPNYYFLLVKGPPAGNKAAAFSSAVRSIASSEIFIVGTEILQLLHLIFRNIYLLKHVLYRLRCSVVFYWTLQFGIPLRLTYSVH